MKQTNKNTKEPGIKVHREARYFPLFAGCDMKLKRPANIY